MSLLTLSIYFLVALVFVFGFKFAGFKGTYFEDSMSLSSTKSLRGLAAILVIFHHISQVEAFLGSSQIQAFYRLGPALVAVFFFFSGYGLIRSFDTKTDYLKGFISKRIVLSLMIPFYVNVILHFIYFLIGGRPFATTEIIAKLLGLSLINGFAWFPIVLILLYLAFYLTFKHIRNQRICFAIILAFILIQGIFTCHFGHFAWWAGDDNWWMAPNAFNSVPWWMTDRALIFSGEWWANSSIGFFVGMVLARKEDKINAFVKRKYWLKLAGSVILFAIFQALTALAQRRFGYWSEYAGNGPRIGDKLICYFSQLPQIIFLLIFIYILRLKIRINNPVTRFFGKYSLHTYLMNYMAIYYFGYLVFKNNKPYIAANYSNLAIYAALVVIFTVILGIVEERICYGITLLIRKVSDKRTHKANA